MQQKKRPQRAARARTQNPRPSMTLNKEEGPDKVCDGPTKEKESKQVIAKTVKEEIVEESKQQNQNRRRKARKRTRKDADFDLEEEKSQPQKHRIKAKRGPIKG